MFALGFNEKSIMANKKITLYVTSVAVVIALIALGFFFGRLSAIPDFPTKPEPPTEEALSDFEVLQLAIIVTESSLDPYAKGRNDDLGLMQITPVYVAEANRILGEERFSHTDALDPDRALEMFRIVQDFHNPSHDISKGIRLHNKAPWYAVKVRRNMEKVRLYERLRENIHAK